MTIIEFFDRTPIENMISCLTVKPDKIIFIGDAKVMKRQGAVYTRFLALRELSVKIEYRSINRHDLRGIIAVLSDIVENEEGCSFDLTGGDDLVLVAMGYVYREYIDKKHIQMHRFNVRNGRVTDCDADGRIPYEGTPFITVEESVVLHGGLVIYSDEDTDGTPIWDFTPVSLSDIDAMWSICRSDPGAWNTQLSVLRELENSGDTDEPLRVYVNINFATNINKRFKFVYLNGLMKALERAGLISELTYDGEILSFFYKNAQVKRCLTKAGTILELKILLVALNTKGNDDEYFFSDAMNGVRIDWDGEIHEAEDEEKDTENEIDVILTKGLIPVFISCKNGAIDDAELYKLSTVTERFGGLYAKKVLVSTYLGRSESSREYIRQRCEDMNIEFISEVHNMEDEEISKLLKRLNF